MMKHVLYIMSIVMISFSDLLAPMGFVIADLEDLQEEDRKIQGETSVKEENFDITISEAPLGQELSAEEEHPEELEENTEETEKENTEESEEEDTEESEEEEEDTEKTEKEDTEETEEEDTEESEEENTEETEKEDTEETEEENTEESEEEDTEESEEEEDTEESEEEDTEESEEENTEESEGENTEESEEENTEESEEENTEESEEENTEESEEEHPEELEENTEETEEENTEELEEEDTEELEENAEESEKEDTEELEENTEESEKEDTEELEENTEESEEENAEESEKEDDILSLEKLGEQGLLENANTGEEVSDFSSFEKNDIEELSYQMLIPAGEENLRISGNFPEGVTATAKKVEINLNDIDGKMEVLVAYDIVLYDRDGQEWQPKEAVVVSFVDEKISQKQAKGDTLEVYHLSDEYLSETEEVSLTQEDLIQSEKVETVASTSEEEVSFVTEHFSVYVIVSVTDYIPSQTCLAQVKADYGYYFSNEASESSKIGVEYLTNQEALETSYTGFSFTGLLKTSTVENADRFYLEFDGDTVYPYTYLAGQKKYLNFVPYTAHTLPSTGDDAELYLTDTKYPFSLTVVEGEECKYYLKQGNFYLNKHKSSLGNVFAGYSLPDERSEIIFTKADKFDPFFLNEKEFVIVNRDRYALGINPIATGNSYVMGLEGIEVNLVSLEDERRVYVPTKKGELPLWKFEAYPGGSYALSTEVQGEKKYLNMATNFADRQNAAISLGTTPQQFEIEVNGSGFSLVSLSDNYHTALDFFYGKKPEKFAGWSEKTVSQTTLSNERMMLGYQDTESVVTVRFHSENGIFQEESLPLGSVLDSSWYAKYPKKQGNYWFAGWYTSETEFTEETRFLLDQEHILKDLDLYPRYLPFEVLTFFAETGDYAQGGFQMMDRDLGAISVGGEGYYYQWGNNFGFPRSGFSTSRNAVDASAYGPENSYFSSIFITQKQWETSQNANLRGGVTNTNEAMQGPCPDGYHIATKTEWETLYEMLFGSNKKHATDFINTLHLGYGFLDQGTGQWKSESLYWYSTYGSNGKAWRFYDNKGAYDTQWKTDNIGRAYPLRCFKNTFGPELTLTFDATTNGGTTSETSLNVEYQSEFSLSSFVATKTGYQFLGWNSDANAHEGIQTITPSRDMTLYAIFKKPELSYSLTFDVNGAQAISATKMSCTIPAVWNNEEQDFSGCLQTLPIITPHEGFQVVGFSTGAEVHTASLNPGNLLQLDASLSGKTYYAQTKKESKNLNASFVGNGATLEGASSTSCTTEEMRNTDRIGSCKVAVPQVIPSQVTPIFIGFNLSASEHTNHSAYNITTKQLTLSESQSGLTWYAITQAPEKKLTVSYKKGRGILALGKTEDSCTLSATYNGTSQEKHCSVIAPTITVKEGYSDTQKIWMDQETSQEVSASETILLSKKNHSYQATTTPLKYTITYDLQGGSHSGARVSYTVEDNPFTLVSPTKQGYLFVGWTGSNGTSPQKDFTLPSDSLGDKQYTANWEPYSATPYHVQHFWQHTEDDAYDLHETEDLQGETDDRTQAQVKSYVGFLEPTVTQKKIAADGSTVVKIYYQRATFSLTFDSAGGSQISTLSQKYDSPVIAPTNPTKTGYTFKEWDPGLPLTIPAENTSFTAQWNPKTIHITLNPGEGTGGTSDFYFSFDTKKYYSDEAMTQELTKIVRPTRTGYTFLHYHSDGKHGGTDGERYVAYQDEDQMIEFADDLATDLYENATLQASWKANSYLLHFDANGGTGEMEEQSFVRDERQTLKKNTFIKTGYHFKHRITSDQRTFLDQASLVNVIDSGMVLLSAVWEKDSSSSQGKTISSRGGSSGGGRIRKDHCPEGDFSDSYYDGKCEKTGKEEKSDGSHGTPERTKEEIDIFQRALKKGLTSTTTLEDFRGNEGLKRSEMAKIISIFSTKFMDKKEEKNRECENFEDIKNITSDLHDYMIKACKLGIMGRTSDGKGVMKKFQPHDEVTKAEAVTVISRIFRDHQYHNITGEKRYEGHLKHLIEIGALEDKKNIDNPFSRNHFYQLFKKIYTLDL